MARTWRVEGMMPAHSGYVADATQAMLPFKYSRAKSVTSCIRKPANWIFQEAISDSRRAAPRSRLTDSYLDGYT
jgi:hypothetical protein